MHYTEHTLTIDSPPDLVYEVLADIEGYARLFPPTESAKVLESGDGYEVARLVVDVSGQLQTWVTRREFEPRRRVITYRQLETAALVDEMQGEWRSLDLGDGRTQLVLTHEFRARQAVGDEKVAGRFTTEEADALLQQAVERNSHADLGAVKTECERRVRAAA